MLAAQVEQLVKDAAIEAGQSFLSGGIHPNKAPRQTATTINISQQPTAPFDQSTGGYVCLIRLPLAILRVPSVAFTHVRIHQHGGLSIELSVGLWPSRLAALHSVPCPSRKVHDHGT